jgi:hypothetical protein
MDKTGGILSIVVAFLLLTSMLLQFDPRVTAGIAIAVLLLLGVYQFTRPEHGR